jgi:hypothetical protein
MPFGSPNVNIANPLASSRLLKDYFLIAYQQEKQNDYEIIKLSISFSLYHLFHFIT